MTFQPLTNYAGYTHVPEAGAVWFHPKNGNAYCCACEKDQAGRQDLSVYRMHKDSDVWELVVRYEGGLASENQVTMGGAGIDQNGDLLVVTSLIIPHVPYITKEKFQGCWIRETGKDESWDYGAQPGPPGPPGPDGAGGIVLFGAPVAHAAWDGRQLSGGETVDIPAVFGVPTASAYLIRFVAQATAADVRVRAGTVAAPYFVTLNTQVAGVQVHTQGWAPGPQIYVSTVNGLATVWLQIVGMSV